MGTAGTPTCLLKSVQCPGISRPPVSMCRDTPAREAMGVPRHVPESGVGQRVPLALCHLPARGEAPVPSGKRCRCCGLLVSHYHRARRAVRGAASAGEGTREPSDLLRGPPPFSVLNWPLNRQLSQGKEAWPSQNCSEKAFLSKSTYKWNPSQHTVEIRCDWGLTLKVK